MNQPSPSNSPRGSADRSRPRQIIHIDLRSLNIKRVKEMIAKGAESIQVLAATDRDSPVCAGLDGQIFEATQVPAVPPENCTCLPFCTCVLTALMKD